MSYLEELETLLRERQVPQERIRGTVEDLAAFLAEGGLDPEEEFGPLTEFADDLLGEEAPEPAPESLVWAADSFAAPERLNEMGAQGWEVDRVDRFGRFVSYRDGEPQGWEYRQEIAPGRRERERLLARLAPEGWEPCGHYFTFAYLKRSRAALAGPAAELSERPEPHARRFLWSGPGLAVIAVCLVLLAVSLYSLGGTLWEGDGPDRAATLSGAGLGALIGAGAVLGVFWLFARFRDR